MHSLASSIPSSRTYAEFARLPTSETTRYEVIDDKLVVTPSPSKKHQQVVGELFGD